jgi:hypothetical protein
MVSPLSLPLYSLLSPSSPPQANLDDKLKSNPNLLFDMLGASEKIALLSRQNEALLHANRMMDQEHDELRERYQNLLVEMNDLKTALPAVAIPPVAILSPPSCSSIPPPPEMVPSPSQPLVEPPSTTVFADLTLPSDTALESHISRYEQQLLYVAKLGEKDLSQTLERYQTESQRHNAYNEESESRLHQLSSDYESLLNQTKTLEKQINPTVATPTTRHTLERALSMPSLFTSSSQETAPQSRTLGSFGRLAAAASRLSIGGTGAGHGISSSHDQTTPSEAPPLEATISSTESSGGDETADPRNSVDLLQKALDDLNHSLSDKANEITAQQLTTTAAREAAQRSDQILASCRRELNKLRQIILFLSKQDTTQQEAVDPLEMVTSPSSTLPTPELVPDADALWAMKNLNQKNAALTEELRSVKQRFSAVIGRMEGFSLSKFTMNVLGGEQHHPVEKEPTAPLSSPAAAVVGSVTSNDEQQSGGGQEESGTERNMIVDDEYLRESDKTPLEEAPIELLFPSPSSSAVSCAPSVAPPADPMMKMFTSPSLTDTAFTDEAEGKESETVELKEKWKPSFVCAVSQWSRKTRREVVFILRVRHVGIDIRDWSVIRSLPDFKTLRGKIKPFIPGTLSVRLTVPHPHHSGSIDGLFPVEGMTLFSVSDDVSEERKEALNSYFVALCSGNHISLGYNLALPPFCLMMTPPSSTSDPASEVIEEFLGVDEYVNMDRIYARDAGLIITSRDVTLL